MAKTVLITGATGLIGRHLVKMLLDQGYFIHTLSRNKRDDVPGIKSFIWDVDKGKIDEQCIENVEVIFHLAGESIAGRAWTKERKKQIIGSRTKSIELLYKLIEDKRPSQIKTIVSASAVGYYGDRNDELLTEESPPGNDFMAKTCIQWEAAVDKGRMPGLRIVKLRTGIVLSDEGGALPALAGLVKAGFGAALGSGRQWVPWIHLSDAIRMYRYVLENEQADGAYNQAAPAPVTNQEMTEILAEVLKKPLWLPGVPSFLLRLILGEKKAVVLSSTRTTSAKITELGFRFQYSSLKEALTDIYDKEKAS